MENFQVFEFLWRYATIVMLLAIVFYITSYIALNMLRNKEITKWSIFVNEIHIILRSIIIVFIAFIFTKYMLLVEFGAIDYFQNNPNHNYADFFNYILDLAQAAHNK